MMRCAPGIVAFSISAGLVGCNGSSLTGPSTVPPSDEIAAAARGMSLAMGWVNDTAFRPVAGARVEVLDGPHAGMSTTTVANGAFQLMGSFDERTRFRATKEGFFSATVTRVTNCPSCPIRFRVTADGPSIDLAGEYLLTLSADSACQDFPDELRNRRYQATIVPRTDPEFLPNTAFSVTLAGNLMLDAYRRFSIHTAGDYLAFFLEDSGPLLVEQTAAESFMVFSGMGGTSIGPSGASTIATTFDGYMHHCTLPSGVFTWSACGAAPGHATCPSKNNRLTLARW